MTISTPFVLSRIPSGVSPFGHGADSHDAEQQRQYDRLATLYESGLRRIGAPVTCLDAPSIYQTIEALGAIRVEASGAHLAVRPIAAIRPFHGLPDYVVFDGPLGDLDRDVPGSLRSADHILMAATRVFCTTALLTDALIARGIVTATTLPPPITTDAAKGSQSILQQLNAIKLDGFEPVTIASVCNATRVTGGQIIYWMPTKLQTSMRRLEWCLMRLKKAGCGRPTAVLSLPVSIIRSLVGERDSVFKALIAFTALRERSTMMKNGRLRGDVIYSFVYQFPPVSTWMLLQPSKMVP